MRPLALAFVALAVVAVGAGSYYAFRPESSGTVAFWVFAAGPSLVLGAVAAAWARREDLLREWLFPRWGDFTRGVVGALLFFGLAFAFARIVAPVGSRREIWLVALYGQLGDPRLLAEHAGAIAATIAVTALAEEVLWRGMVTQVLAERVGSRTAWLWAAGLYALAYAPSAWSLRAGWAGTAGAPGVHGIAALDPILVVAALAGGLLWGAMARGFGRLAPGVLAHALFDWAVVMMFPLWPPHH
jgi:membrane protease YdiL (CAAX protease family)